MDYYKVLSCSRDANHMEIKQAYHRCLLQFHPDKNKKIVVAESHKFHQVREAWRVLGHTELREEYDATCKQKELEEDYPIYEHFSATDLQQSIFGTFCLRCRCGGYYLVEEDDLREKNIALQVTCDGCTLMIVIET